MHLNNTNSSNFGGFIANFEQILHINLQQM